MRALLLAGLAFLSSSAAAQGVWAGLDGGTNGTVRALATGPEGSVYVGGEFTAAGGLTTGPIARWDGSSWHPMVGLTGWVEALGIGADGTVLAAGGMADTGNGQPGCASRWTGAAWEPVGVSCRPHNGIYSAAVLPDGTPVIGGRDFGGVRGLIAWNGTAWTDLGTGPGGSLDGNVWALAVAPDGRLYAGGEYLSAGGKPLSSCVARWTGTEWQAVGTGLERGSNADTCVLSLAFGPGGELYAGGFLRLGDDPAAHGVARLVNGAWTALPASFSEPGVWALRFDVADRLYTGRLFAPGLTVWDGSAWNVLSPDESVYALALDGTGRLIVGGHFGEMGGVASSNVIAYTPALTGSEPPPDATAFRVWPNPAADAAQMRTASGGRTEVHDALGRVLWSGQVAPGTTALPTARLAPGIYVVRLVTGDEAASQRLVVGR